MRETIFVNRCSSAKGIRNQLIIPFDIVYLQAKFRGKCVCHSWVSQSQLNISLGGEACKRGKAKSEFIRAIPCLLVGEE